MLEAFPNISRAQSKSKKMSGIHGTVQRRLKAFHPFLFSINNLSSEDVKRIAYLRLGSHFLEIEKGLLPLNSEKSG